MVMELSAKLQRSRVDPPNHPALVNLIIYEQPVVRFMIIYVVAI